MNGNSELSDEYIGEGEDHVMTFDVQDTADLYVANVVTENAQATQNGMSKLVPSRSTLTTATNYDQAH